MTEKRQTSQGYIIRILQHFATKLRNITICDALSSWDEIFAQAYLDQNFTHKGKGLLSRSTSNVWTLMLYGKKQMIRNEVGNLRVKPLELSASSYALRVKPRPRPNNTHFRQGLNSKKETQLGKFELSP